MKHLLYIILLLGVFTLHAQQTADRFSGNQTGQTRNPKLDQMNFVPNQVIVKFTDEAPIKSGAALKTAGINNVDQILKANGVDSLIQLFPNLSSGLLRNTGTPRIVKDPQGQDMLIPALDKIFLIKIPQLRSTNTPPVNIFQLIEELKNQPEVEYAEPNYIYSIDDLKPVGPELTAEDLERMHNSLKKVNGAAVVPNDPLYGQQWYIPAVKADLVWGQTTGDTTQVIGILDTGVDWNHPDLKNKIWTNPDEIPNNGRDDDGNGLIDDIRGWDYINNDNNPMDDNSHGTHVAGIAAAESNNGIGIAGVNWQTRILPLKVFQSSGRGDAANISQAIIYAMNKGVTVINMSFGSYARSMAMEDALANAYATTILVAAAGNDALALESCTPAGQFFPACLSFVLGVQSPEASFSNYDCNGPTYSNHPELLNYEMKAPGTNIISTVPNGNYRVYQGTSMSTPIVSGSICLYMSKHPNETQELMWGNLINSMGSNIDIYSAINMVPTPRLMFVSKTLVDTLAGDYKNGLINAGETIQLWFSIRNNWGHCDSAKVGIRFGEFEDNSLAQIINPTALIGSISPYATRTNESDPLLLHINPNVAHGRDIVFTAYLYYPNSPDTIYQSIILNVNNGVELSGVMDSTMELTADRLWLVNQSFKIGGNGILIFKPGSKLISTKKMFNSGKMIGKGTSDSTITIIGTAIFGGIVDFDYALFQLSANEESSWRNFDHVSGFFSNCDLLLSGESYCFTSTIPTFENCRVNCFATHFFSSILSYNFISSDLTIGSWSLENGFFEKCNLLGMGIGNGRDYINPDRLLKCNILEQGASIGSVAGDFYTLPPSIYFGTTNSEKIGKKIHDFYDDPSFAQIDFKKNLVTFPFDSTHAIVWKVLVNGKDAQDEVVDPVGVGKQRFDVYFSREMDTTFTPKLTFGVRSPYTQQVVSDSGYWDSTHKIWTAYKTIKLTTGDGINYIRVAGAKEANGWHHEIPVEDKRFEFIINAVTSSSLEFMATPGLGKVNLEWNNNDLEDGLGYNMYRMQHINDSTLTEAILVNSSLITDTLYTDYSVVPNKKYYYFYKIVRTDLSETDPSKAVSAIPFTASKGDANGDLNVNVLDITTIVAHLLQHNPQPFIFEAADYNSDAVVNVLDIVGVVNHVLYGDLRSAASTEDQVCLYLRNDTLFADATTDIGGLQLEITGISSIEQIMVLTALEGFESGYSQLDSSHIRLIYYSLSGKVIPAGKRIPLLSFSEGEVASAIAGDKTGKNIPMSLTAPSEGNSSRGRTVLEAGQNYPNPASNETVIPVILHKDMDQACLRIYDLQGIEVNTIRLLDASAGNYDIVWRAEGRKGVFIYRLEARKAGEQYVCPVRKMVVL